MIKVKIKDSYQQKMNRIKRLPRLKYMNSLFFSMCYGDSLRMVKAFHDGVKKNAFGLKPLKDGTIRRKQSLGMELPGVPLYGEGDNSENKSYVNMLRLTKLKNGYKVYPSRGRHYSGKITLEHLFNIHENGAIIKRGDTLIRIPARPAFLKAFEKVATEKRQKERSRIVKNVATQFINTANTAQFLKEIDRETKGLLKYDIKD